MTKPSRRYSGTLTFNRKWTMRFAALALLVLAAALFFGPVFGIGDVVYLRPIGLIAGLGVALLIAAEFTPD